MVLAVRIPAVLRLTVLEASSESARLEVLSNLPTYQLRFDLTDADVAAVEIHGLGPPFVVGREGGLYPVLNRSAGGHVPARHRLSYRVIYDRAVPHGARPVPLRVSADAS